MTEMTADDRDFEARTTPYRRELLAHCYRILGSYDEAEDLVQETYLRAWRAYDRFEGRSTIRSWLYRIATNACLTALDGRTRRALPTGLGAPASDPDTPVTPAPEVAWLQPLPDALISGEADDPASVAVTRESVRLALVASLQYLPARQRAVLVLRDVLGFRANEVADMLETSVVAVKSALQRARTRLEEVRPELEQVGEPTDPAVRELLEQYIAAFEASDGAMLERALRRDVGLELVGSLTWFGGLVVCMPYFQAYALGNAGDWSLHAVEANGQPAAVAYRRGPDGTYHAFGLSVLTTTPEGIARITLFADPSLVERCALPPTLPAA